MRKEGEKGSGCWRRREKEGEINGGLAKGRRDGGWGREEKSKGQEGRKETERGNLEDCVPLARCSARGGLLPLEATKRKERRSEAEGKEKGEKTRERARGESKATRRGRHHVVNHGPVASMYYILSLSAESGPVHATALWRTMFNHLCVDSFGFN